MQAEIAELLLAEAKKRVVQRSVVKEAGGLGRHCSPLPRKQQLKLEERAGEKTVFQLHEIGNTVHNITHDLQHVIRSIP